MIRHPHHSRVLTLALVLGAAATLVPAQSLIIPQIADGGGWKTTLVLGNTTSSAATANVSFFQDTTNGATTSWAPPFIEGGSTQNLSVPPGGTIFRHTYGTAATTTTGWAQVQTVPGVVAYAIFTQSVAGRPDQDGTAAAAPSVTRILMPYDNTNSFVTSMAIVNVLSTSETIYVGIQPTTGSNSQAAPITLPAAGHMAFTVPQQFSLTANQSGMLEFDSTGSFSVLALRFNPTGSLTTAPVFAEIGPPAIVPLASTPISGLWAGATVGGKGVSGSSPSGLMILGLTQIGQTVTGNVRDFSYTPAISEADINGTVLATGFNFASDHFYDSSGCGAQFTGGTATVTGDTMQGSATFVADTTGVPGCNLSSMTPSTFPVQFSLKLAVEQYCGTYSASGDSGLFLFLVASDGSIVGTVTSTVIGARAGAVTLTGQVTGNTVTMSTNGNLGVNGTIQNGVVSGLYGTAGGTFTASAGACQ